MEATTTRAQNKAAVLSAALAAGQCTRSSIETRTGLSKATVARIVDELLGEGLLQPGAELHREGRGRKSLYLELGTQVGCVVGVDLGLTTTRLWCADLRGTELARSRFDTPKGLTRLAMVRRLVAEVQALIDGTAYSGRLSGVVVAVVGSVRNEVEIVRAAAPFSYLEGSQFCAALERHFAVPVILDSDANMALCGEMVDGVAVDTRDAALLIVSTSVRAGLARDGRVLRSDRSLIGELAWLPVPSRGSQRRCLDDVLSARGVLAAAHHSDTAADIAELAAADDRSELATARGEFVDGLVVAVSTVALTVDPDIVVVTGRMLPVVERVLGEVNEQLKSVLPAVPRLVLASSNGFAAAHGAALTAVDGARTRLMYSIVRQPITDVV
ncbi:ROK family protein [Mycolicibacterium sp. HK-90]|uniref:ROK family protein n=1 Tax=Mycolicibacterium sp. HK-90 TaxID=3056937 RepID=UPI002657C969|nr:ROK family protein [Mycolicibacterium sp. HK-90]WKG03963.1 ROK family protein [Mycolicibacterium sp. HK-90]